MYLFDVDGTLTPAKSQINHDFAKQFLNWCKGRQVYIVSGGSFMRILNQLKRPVFDQMQGIFACMGNAYYQNKFNDADGYSEWVKVYENKFNVKNKQELLDELEWIVKDSPFHIKTGKHYEERVGMLNFSVVGRNATMEQRKIYEDYDAKFNERQKIVEKLSKKYKDIDFVVGGAVSIDIFNKGSDKSQVIKQLEGALKVHQVIFVGDRISFPGNDYSLAKVLHEHTNGHAIEVESWKDTAKLLSTDLFASG
jgi:phosphomannomutase